MGITIGTIWSWPKWEKGWHDDAGEVLQAKDGKYEVSVWEAEGKWVIDFSGTAKSEAEAKMLAKRLLQEARNFEADDE